MLDGSEGPSTTGAAAGGSAVVGTSGAIPAQIPAHGIVPTVQLVYCKEWSGKVLFSGGYNADRNAIYPPHRTVPHRAETSSLQST